MKPTETPSPFCLLVHPLIHIPLTEDAMLQAEGHSVA